jgi:hypothetical protein
MEGLGKERNIHEGNYVIKGQSHKRKYKTKMYLEKEN